MAKNILNSKKKYISVDSKYFIISIISVLSFFIIWQGIVYFEIIPTKYLPTPTRVFALLFEKFSNPNPDGAVIQVNILSSFIVVMAGFITAIVVGIPLGLLMGWYKNIDRFVRPIFEVIRPMPPIAWIPLTILWIGIGLEAKAMIIFVSCFVPCVINSYTGIKETKQTLINVSKTFGANKFVSFLRVGIPSALPMVFAGIQISLSSAWGTVVAAELLAANAGLGFMISMGRQFARADIIVLGMMVIGFLGFISAYIVTKIENILVRWKTI